MVVTLSGELVVGAAGATLTGPPALLFNISGDEITGPSAFSVAPLANETRLEGEGQLGNGTIELTNAASGSIFSLGTGTLTLNTGANTILNAGVIASEGTGGLTISSPVDNTGELIAYSSPLTVSGAVTGNGTAELENAANLIFDGNFNRAIEHSSQCHRSN
jgi:hypothetical protein